MPAFDPDAIPLCKNHRKELVYSIISVLRVVISAMLLIATTLAAQVTPEEREIRQTYAKIALAVEIGAVQGAVFQGKDMQKELANSHIEFRLSDFRVGRLADHLNDPYSEFLSRPNGQDHLQIAPGTWNSEEDNRYSYHNVYATVKWVHGGSVAPVEWDTMPVVHAMDAVHATDGSTMVRFASYTVQTIFQGETQTTRATWWYGTDKDGQPMVITGDNLNDSAAIAFFRSQKIYPAAFLDNPRTRKKSAVVKWLESKAQDCPGNKHDNCYDETTGKAGISREDIDRGPVVLPKPTSELLDLRHFEINRSCKGDDCDTAFSRTNLVSITPRGGIEGHASGSHVFANTSYGSCIYTGNSGTCFNNCSASPNGSFYETPGSTYTSIFVNSHTIAVAQSGGNQNAQGATSCGSVFGGSVVACFINGCAAHVSVSGTSNGIGASVGFDPTAVYSDQSTYSISCAAKTLGTDTTPGGCSSTAVEQCDSKTNVKCLDPLTNEFASCHGEWDDSTCSCVLTPWNNTPIIIHVGDGEDDGRTIELTSPQSGVVFAIHPGHPEQFSWPAAGSKDAFLVLDRNDNGTIDDGSEMFGNFTPQPPTPTPNGFLALAEYDLHENGGNGNGIIDPGDAIYSRLRLWIDQNHDGISQADELYTLAGKNVQFVSLSYRETRYTDQYGNQFRYRARVVLTFPHLPHGCDYETS